jgi:hypothetical protein
MNEKKGLERAGTVFLYAAGVALVLIALAFVIGVINLGKDLVTTWLLAIFQVFLVVVGAAVAIAVAYWLSAKVYYTLGRRIDNLAISYEREHQWLRRRAPAFIVTLTIVSQAILILADKSFSGDVLTTVLVSILLLLLFWLAIELTANSRKLCRLLGYILYAFGILYLPFAIFLYHGLSIQEVWLWFSGLELRTILIMILTLVLLVFLPVVTQRGFGEQG